MPSARSAQHAPQHSLTNSPPHLCSAGTFGVACVVDGDGAFIVAIVCTNSCPDAEVLLKSKEVAHAMKVRTQAASCRHLVPSTVLQQLSTQVRSSSFWARVAASNARIAFCLPMLKHAIHHQESA